MKLRATKIFRFESAHSLPNHGGKCRSLHGHNYKLEVTFIGEMKTEGPEKGMVMDFGNIKQAVNDYIKHWDHKYLNDFIKNPTAEVMVAMLSHEFTNQRKLDVINIKLWETDDSFVEWCKNDNQ